jgi:hypothetical protein
MNRPYFARTVRVTTDANGVRYQEILWWSGDLEIVFCGVAFRNVTPAEQWFVYCGGLSS